MADSLSSIGLLMAAVTSISNVVKDVGAKKVVDVHELVASTFWIRLFAAVVFVGALVFRAWMGRVPVIRGGGPLFGIESLDFGPMTVWLVYLTIEVVLVACSTLLFFRAIQVSPISLCMPYISFTPVFLIATGYLMLGELPARVKLIGVVLIFIGSIVMHRQLFSAGWLEPIKAIWRERGCFYMLMVGFINSITNPIDKKLVGMSDAFTQGCSFGIGMVVFFSVLAVARRADTLKVIRSVPGWAILAGALEAVALLFQLSSHYYIDVVITISIKRAGIILTVLLGWLIFKERNIGDKLIAASVMLVGVLIIYLPLNLLQGTLIALSAIAVMSLALFLTRKPPLASPEVAPLPIESAKDPA
jgi:drug/metabolite transporter (DMT)-like permease